MNTALLIMVHGSPKPESNHAVYLVADLIRNRGAFAHVEVGFLDCNDPDIPTAIDNCVNRGVQGIVACPYFLHTGNHVAEDIPTILEAANKKYPQIEILMTNFLGQSESVTDVLQDRAGESVT